VRVRCQFCGKETDVTVFYRCYSCGCTLVVGDGLPTMGEQYESELSKEALNGHQQSPD